jgi:hypothetical protein
MGVIAPKKRIEIAHKKWSQQIEETHLIPKVSKKFSGKGKVSQGSKKDEVKSHTCLNYVMFLEGNSIVIETIPYLASKGNKGNKKSLPHIKRVIGVVSQESFERSSVIDFPLLAKSLGLTPNELLKRCKSFAEKHSQNHKVDQEYRKTFTSHNGIVRVIKQS